jgi:cobalt-zinc-cadmium efflux system membrane fusion protein
MADGFITIKKRIIPMKKNIIICAALVMLYSCGKKETNDNSRTPYLVPDSLMRTLRIDTVKTTDVTDAIRFNGTVDFNTDKVANIFPLVSGVVQGINVVPGDYVKAGQELGVVSSAEVANYNSALVTAQTNVTLTAKQLAQQKDLYKSGLASQVDVTNAEVSYEQAVASEIAAKKILNINGNDKNGQFFIKSPINGFIVQMNVTNGMAIRTDNNAGLFTISDLKDVWVDANVYEENISKVHLGDSVDVSTISYPGQIFRGKVDKLMNVLDPTTKAMKMRVVLQNPGYLLKPQMFATVTLNDDEHKRAISVSSKALIFDNSQYYVIVVTGNKNVQIRPVQLISNNGKTAYIQAGLAPGERVIASDAILIYGSLNS